MIDLNNKNTKDYFDKLIDSEISNIGVSLNEQKELNGLVLHCLNNVSSNMSFDINSETLNQISADLVSVSQLLNKMSFNFSSYAKLMHELETIKSGISITDRKTLNDIEQYNQSAGNVIKRIASNTSKIEDVLTQNNLFARPRFNAQTDEIIEPTKKTSKAKIEKIDEIVTEDNDTLEAPVISPSLEQLIKQNTEKKIVIEEPVQEIVETIEEVIPETINEKKEVTEELLFDIPMLLAKASANIPTLDLTDDNEEIEEPLLSKKVDALFATEKPIITQTTEPETDIEDTQTLKTSEIVENIFEEKEMVAVAEETPSNILTPEIEIPETIETLEEADESTEEELPTNTLVENTLIISENDGKVVLPYTIAELKNIIEDDPGTYDSLQDIVDKVFTKPLKNYKNAASARFREAYRLIRKKESGSVGEALDLGMELFSNYNLHPAIITACKNLNELDIYLSCLEYDELHDFKYFKIQFQSVPTAKTMFGKLGGKKKDALAKTFAITQAAQKGKRIAE